jgi:transposase
MAAAGPGDAEDLWFCVCDHYGGFVSFTFGTVGAIAPGTAIGDCGTRGDHCGISIWGAADDRSFGFVGVGDSCATGVAMIPVPAGVRIWIATGHTDMRRGMRGLALQVQEGLGRDPHAGDVFVFRGRSGSLIKAIWHDGVGLSLYAKRLDRGKFIWPQTVDGVVSLTAGQMSYLLEAIDWRNPQHTWRPQSAG